MLKKLVMIIAISLAGVQIGAAQRAPFGAEGIQVNASFQTMVPLLTQGSLQDENKAAESARQSLYEIASRECDVISKVFNGECRLMNIGVNSHVQDRGNGLRGINISVNATFRVVLSGAK